MTAPNRATLVLAFQALAAGRPGAAEALVDLFMGPAEPGEEGAEVAQPIEHAKTELHTYADGSQVVGTAPFPEKSPLEIAAESMERVGAPAEAPAPAPAPSATQNMITADQVQSTPQAASVEPTTAELETIAAQIVPEPEAAAPAAAPAPAPTSSRKR